MRNNNERISLKPSEIPLESSLGLLAYGDIAFIAWREKKKINNILLKKEKENN